MMGETCLGVRVNVALQPVKITFYRYESHILRNLNRIKYINFHYFNYVVQPPKSYENLRDFIIISFLLNNKHDSI